MSIALSVASVFLIPVFTSILSPPATIFLVALVAIVLASFVVQRSVLDFVLHPRGGALIIITAFTIAPAIFGGLGLSLGRLQPGDISEEAVVTLAVGLCAFGLGSIFGERRPVGNAMDVPWSKENASNLRLQARVVMLLAVTLNVAIRSFGEAAILFSFMTLLPSVSVSIGVTAAAITSRKLDTPLLTLFAVYALLSFADGSRSSTLGPLGLIIYWTLFRGRRKEMILLLLASVACVYVFIGVGQTRSSVSSDIFDAAVWREGPSTTEIFRPLSSVALTTQMVVGAIDSGSPHTAGSTYVAAVGQALLPIVGEAVDWLPTAGAASFREITGYRGRSGLHYSTFAEAYAAGGILAVVLVSGLFGTLCGFAWTRRQYIGVRSIGILYPLLWANLLYGIRTDAVAHVKLVLYPLIGVYLALRISKKRTFRST